MSDEEQRFTVREVIDALVAAGFGRTRRGSNDASDDYERGLAAGIAQERERCARVAEAEEQECETMRSAYANDAYNWSFWERSRKTASSIAAAIRAGEASE